MQMQESNKEGEAVYLDLWVLCFHGRIGAFLDIPLCRPAKKTLNLNMSVIEV